MVAGSVFAALAATSCRAALLPHSRSLRAQNLYFRGLVGTRRSARSSTLAGSGVARRNGQACTSCAQELHGRAVFRAVVACRAPGGQPMEWGLQLLPCNMRSVNDSLQKACPHSFATTAAGDGADVNRCTFGR